MPLKTPLVPISWGELIDKITILEIKTERLSSDAARANVRRELALLRKIETPALAGAAVAGLKEQLKAVNGALWVIEDDIRDKEAAKAFDADFIALARAVYRQNDQRAALKRQINDALGSELIEEKGYKPY